MILRIYWTTNEIDNLHQRTLQNISNLMKSKQTSQSKQTSNSNKPISSVVIWELSSCDPRIDRTCLKTFKRLLLLTSLFCDEPGYKTIKKISYNKSVSWQRMALKSFNIFLNNIETFAHWVSGQLTLIGKRTCNNMKNKEQDVQQSINFNALQNVPP